MRPLLILGAGPAGAAVALGLRRLGYAVALVSEWRRFPALEGVWLRVLEALRGAGLGRALEAGLQASQRQVAWNGQSHGQNVEYLLDRPRFDRGLREDLREAGVELIEGRVLEVQSTASGHRLRIEGRAGRHRQRPCTALRTAGPGWRARPMASVTGN
ncbi:hypothetical protein EMIT0324P_20046 [Pseudomonas chlororaphis]